MSDQRFDVQHRPDESRYALIDNGEDGTAAKEIGEESYLDIPADNRTERIFYHTLVNEEYGGQGLASRLVRVVVEEAITAGLAVVPVCPYVVQWLQKHSEYAEHVVQATPEHLQALRRIQ